MEKMDFFCYKITAAKKMIDANNHVNNVVYVQLMQDAATAHAVYVGDTKQTSLELNYTWVTKTHFIDYIKPIFLGEEVLIKTWVEEIKMSSCLRKYSFENPSGKVFTRAQTVYVTIDPARQRPVPIPEKIKKLYPIFKSQA